MNREIPSRVAGIVFIGTLVTACCQQPQGAGTSNAHSSNTGNCHTHKENAAKGTTKHCHAHVNGSNHSHTYGRQTKAPAPSANLSSEVIDPYAKDVLSSYRN